MVVCRFFLQGNCKFGNNCWHEHTNDKHRFGLDHFKKYHYENEKSYPQQNTNPPFYVQSKDIGFSFNQTLSNISPHSKFEVLYEPTKSTDSDNKEFQPEELKNIEEDVISWSLGNMWPFTCYSPRNRNCLSCFKDISPEELRWGTIEAEHTGSLQSYLQNINETLNQINIRREELKHPTSQYLKSLNINNTNNSQTNFENKESVLARTSFKLPENNNFQKVTPPSNGPRNDFKFSFSNLSGQQSSQFASTNNSRQNIFNSGNNNAKSFSFTLAAAELEKNSFPFASSSSSENAEESLNNFNIKSQQNFGNMTSTKDKLYTELNLLSKTEKEQFMASEFVLGMIPTKPPPIELCF